MCRKNRNRDQKWSEFKTPPNATSRRVSLVRYRHATDNQRSFTQAIRGLKGGLGVGREGVEWVGRIGEAEGVPGKHNQNHHPYHLTIPSL
jgi:hypothetical protein